MPKTTTSNLAQRLAHVRWIGGSPCAGKSTIADHLAAQHGLQIYHCDAFFPAHMQAADPAQQPTLHTLQHMSWDSIWLQPLAALVERVVLAYREEFDQIVADLLALPADTPILAEGTALMPELLAGLGVAPNRAIWLVPSEAFQRAAYPARGEWVQSAVRDCSDPEQAFRNWMDRDVTFARGVAQDAAARGLRLVEVDGTRSIADHAALIERWFQLA